MLDLPDLSPVSGEEVRSSYRAIQACDYPDVRRAVQQIGEVEPAHHFISSAQMGGIGETRFVGRVGKGHALKDAFDGFHEPEPQEEAP